MLISTPGFFIFLLAVWLAFWGASALPRVQLAILALANFFFLAKFGLQYLALPLATTADFLIGHRMQRANGLALRRCLLLLSLILNLGLLIGLKLTPFWKEGRWTWVFPLTLSFYCFQSLTYTIDIYRGDGKATSDWLTYMVAALFFPVVTAGPIPRTRKLLGQLSVPISLTSESGSRAMMLIGLGLVKKLLIADFISSNIVDRVFDTPALYSSGETLVGVYGYALQIFFDFSGYTDIALGVGLLLGIRLPENFRRPYLSEDISDFWRRWHISFSMWLRDYLFDVIPKSRQHLVLSYGFGFVVTMALGGLWHGISWTFLVWGLLHGFALFVTFAWKRWNLVPPNQKIWLRVVNGLLTFHFVCFTWIFFRASSLEDAIAVLRSISRLSWSASNLTPLMLGVLLLAAVGHSLPTQWFEVSAGTLARLPFWAQGLAMAAVILLIETLAGRGSSPFVYGNF